MKTFADRVIEALAEHERLLQQVGLMKKQIGEHLKNCPVMLQSAVWSSNAEYNQFYDEKGLVKTHLWHAFNDLIDSDSGYGQCRMEYDDQENYLTDPWNDDTRCDHCYAAWRVIQDRKDVRQKLGSARRAIRALGKSAMKVAPCS